MRILPPAMLLSLALSGCLAFRPDLSGSFTSTQQKITPRSPDGGSISQKRPLRMMSFEAADGASLVEAVNHAAYVLAAAADDASRGGAAVEQIPYVPGDVADFDKILLGSAACVGAYAWGAYEFGSVSKTAASQQGWWMVLCCAQ